MNRLIALSLLLPVAAVAQSKKPSREPTLPPPPANSVPAQAVVLTTADPQPQRSAFVAPKVGLFVPTSRMSSALYVAAEAGYVTPLLERHLSAVVELSYTRPRAAGVLVDPRLISGAGGEYTEGNAEVAVQLSAVYRFAEQSLGLTPYAGLGPGVTFQRTTIDAFGSRYTETEARLGFQLLGGAELKLGPGAVFGEVRYHFSRVDFLSTGNANAGGFVLPALGYRLSM